MGFTVDGLVFDLDDTLFDFEQAFGRAVREFYYAKPDPRIFRDALDATGLARGEQVMFVGDNPVADIDGARRFGMRTAWVRRGRQFPAGLNPPDHMVDSVLEVQGVLGRW